MKRLMTAVILAVLVGAILVPTVAAQWQGQPELKVRIHPWASPPYWEMYVAPGWTSPNPQTVRGEVTILTKAGAVIWSDAFEITLLPGWGLEGYFGMPYLDYTQVNIRVCGFVEGPEGGAGWCGLLSSTENSDVEGPERIDWYRLLSPSNNCSANRVGYVTIKGDARTSLLIAKIWNGNEWTDPQYMAPYSINPPGPWGTQYIFGGAPSLVTLGLFERGESNGQTPVWTATVDVVPNETKVIVACEE